MMVRKATLEKYTKIKKLLKQGKSIRFIKTTLECSTDTINKAKNYVPENKEQLGTSKTKIRTPITTTQTVPNRMGTNRNKKGTVELTIMTHINEILLSYGKQYGAFKLDKNKKETSDFKHPERMRRMNEVEESLSKKYSITFDYAFQRKANQELKIFHRELDEINGVK